MKRGKVPICVILAILTLTFAFPLAAHAESSASNGVGLKLNCESAILMEASTGKVLYEQDPDVPLPPASVTKIMTLLLVMEAIEDGRASYGDTVVASAKAASMGGSQIYLKEGEKMTLDDLVKSVVIASANDAALALAEHIYGSEEAFVEKMNEKARQLGMKNTVFENTNGLDDTADRHVSSARDIAIMSKELMSHEKIFEYSTRWMDTVRDGAFGLTNTNRLVRFYDGCTGLKTGSTSKAGFCISATACRNGMSLIAVIMSSPTRDERNGAAKELLDWGYANFELYVAQPQLPSSIKVVGGLADSVLVSGGELRAVLPKGSAKSVKAELTLPPSARAPVNEGEAAGYVEYTLNGDVIERVDVNFFESVSKVNYFGMVKKIVAYFLLIL